MSSLRPALSPESTDFAWCSGVMVNPMAIRFSCRSPALNAGAGHRCLPDPVCGSTRKPSRPASQAHYRRWSKSSQPCRDVVIDTNQVFVPVWGLAHGRFSAVESNLTCPATPMAAPTSTAPLTSEHWKSVIPLLQSPAAVGARWCKRNQGSPHRLRESARNTAWLPAPPIPRSTTHVCPAQTRSEPGVRQLT